MIISIGGFVFNGVLGNGFDSIDTTKYGEHVEQKLLDGAMTRFDGRKLSKKVFSAQWIGIDEGERVEDLDALLSGYHQISDSDGNNLGLWTVDSIKDMGTDIFKGAPICHKVTLSLTEYR